MQQFLKHLTLLQTFAKMILKSSNRIENHFINYVIIFLNTLGIYNTFAKKKILKISPHAMKILENILKRNFHFYEHQKKKLSKLYCDSHITSWIRKLSNKLVISVSVCKPSENNKINNSIIIYANNQSTEAILFSKS